MGVLFRNIPLIEMLLILTMLGLGGLGCRSLPRGAKHPDIPRASSTGTWILFGLCGLALLAIILLFLVTLVKG
jgi:hypothetical protein